MYLGSTRSVEYVLFACTHSLIALSLLVALHPLTLNTERWASHPCLGGLDGWLEEAVFSLWRLSTRALTTSVLSEQRPPPAPAHACHKATK